MIVLTAASTLLMTTGRNPSKKGGYLKWTY